MKPPKASQGTPSGAVDLPPAVFARSDFEINTLVKRRDFLTLNHCLRWGTKGFLLQARKREDNDPLVRVGFTCSKKVGNAVARNRAKRRLREIARLGLPELGRQGWDYCLIGKAQVTANRNFTQMQNDLRYALRKVHTKADT